MPRDAQVIVIVLPETVIGTAAKGRGAGPPVTDPSEIE